MKNVIILGSGGFSREVIWLIEELNKGEMQFNIMGMITYNKKEMEKIDYPYLGDDSCLNQYSNKDIGIILAIGSPEVRKLILEKTKRLNFIYPNLIASSAVIGKNIKIGHGNIICAQTVLTTDIEIGDFNIMNLSCTVGHDSVIKNFTTINPGSNISGNVTIEDESEIGTGVKIIQGVHIAEKSIIGAGGVVVRDTQPNGTYIGVPVKRKQ